MKHIRRFDRVFEALANDDREVMDSIQEITDTLGQPTYGYKVDFEYFNWNLNIHEMDVNPTLDTEITRDQFEKFTSIIADIRDNAIQVADRLSERFEVKFKISTSNLIITLYPKMYQDILNNWKKFNETKEEKVVEKTDELSEFADTREAGAEKIANNAHEKGGLALLTWHHFKVKLPYYKKAASGKFDMEEAKKEFDETYKSISTDMDQIEFQREVGRLEVLGELIIKNKKTK
jgi:hypothetical protein